MPASTTEPDVDISRLPVTGPDLFGREAELAWLDACWNEGVRVASIVASGGVGKSSLVNAWLRRMDAAGWRGATRVYAWSFHGQGTDRPASSDELVAAALRWFGDAEPDAGAPWDRGERLSALVRKERVLLVLDGLEPLQGGPGAAPREVKDLAVQALVEALSAQNMGLCLITTRIAVEDLEALVGDRVRMHELAPLSAEAGAELLRARGAKGAEADLQAASREYAGHGLSLALLGAHVRMAHRGDIRERDTIPAFTGPPARRMIALYEKWLARKPEMAILRMMAFFDRPAPVDEIEVLRGRPTIRGLTTFLVGPPRPPRDAWERAVTTLRDAGLVALRPGTDGGEAFDTHPLVREHFAELLRRDHPDAWREGHRRLFEHLKGRAKPLPDTVLEMVPLYAAVRHGCLAGATIAAIDVYGRRVQRGDLQFNWSKLGSLGSSLAVLSAFYDPPWERALPGLPPHVEALVLNQTGFELRAAGRLSEAAELLELSVGKTVALQDWRNAAQACANLVDTCHGRGALGEALSHAEEAVDLADRSGHRDLRVLTRAHRAAALHAAGRADEAAALFEEAERMQREANESLPLLHAHHGFQYCDLLLDRRREADVMLRAAQVMGWERGRTVDVALDHLSLGRAHLLAVQRGTGGDLDEAAGHVMKSVEGLRRAGHQDRVPLGLLARAALHTHSRAFDPARRDLDDALTIAARFGFRLHEADAHLGHARLLLAEGTPAAALDHLAKARALITATGYHRRDEELAALEAACR